MEDYSSNEKVNSFIKICYFSNLALNSFLEMPI